MASDDDNFVMGKKAAYGKIEGLQYDPKNIPKGFNLNVLRPNKIFHAETTYEGMSDGLIGLVCTTQPAVDLDETLESYPDGWTECLISPSAKRHIVSTKGFPAPLPRRAGPPAYRIGPSPLGGTGMFATRDLHVGDFIVAERALIIAPSGLTGAPGTEALKGKERYRALFLYNERNLEFPVGRLPEEHKDALMALHNSHTEDGSGPIFGILRTNGYHVSQFGEDPTVTRYSGVFNELSRINHSCGPNTTRYFDEKSFSMQLYAIRDIKAGEEITTSYCGLRQPTATRQKALEPYGFTCACKHCTDPTSDARRKRILKDFDSSVTVGRFKMWLENRRLPEEMLINETAEALRVMEREGLEELEHYPANLMHMCAVHSALGRDYGKYQERFTKWYETQAEEDRRENTMMFQAIVTPQWRVRVEPNGYTPRPPVFVSNGEQKEDDIETVTKLTKMMKGGPKR